MKPVAAFIRKEFRHIFRDPRTMLVVLVMPLVQIILFGYALSTDIRHAGVDVVGDMDDPVVRGIVNRVANNPSFEVGEILPSMTQAGERLRSGRAGIILCFGDGFDRSLSSEEGGSIQIVADGSDPNTAVMTVGILKGVLQEAMGQDMNQAGVMLFYNPAMYSSFNFVPGVMGLIFMLICTMMTSVSIVREKETGTMEPVLVSPMKPFGIIVSKLTPYLFLSLVNFASVLLLSCFVMGVPLRGSLMLLTLVTVLFIMVSLALGLLISEAASSQQTALLLCGLGLMMPSMMLSGLIFPCESMPPVLQAVSDILPVKWYIIMVKKIMIQGSGPGDMIVEFSVLAGMMVFLMAVSVKCFRKRL